MNTRKYTEERQEEQKTKNTHQLNERQPSIAVGHDEDILGLCSGHKVVPHVKNVLFGRCIVLQDTENQRNVRSMTKRRTEVLQTRKKGTWLKKKSATARHLR